MNVAQDAARTMTQLMRTNNDPFWDRLRFLLHERGIDTDTAILADCFPDDTDFEYGVVVTRLVGFSNLASTTSGSRLLKDSFRSGQS